MCTTTYVATGLPGAGDAAALAEALATVSNNK